MRRTAALDPRTQSMLSSRTDSRVFAAAGLMAVYVIDSNVGDRAENLSSASICLRQACYSTLTRLYFISCFSHYECGDTTKLYYQRISPDRYGNPDYRSASQAMQRFCA